MENVLFHTQNKKKHPFVQLTFNCIKVLYVDVSREFIIILHHKYQCKALIIEPRCCITSVNWSVYHAMYDGCGPHPLIAEFKSLTRNTLDSSRFLIRNYKCIKCMLSINLV